MSVSVQVCIRKQARQEAAPLSVSPKHERIHLSPTHSTTCLVYALAGRDRPFTHPITVRLWACIKTCTDKGILGLTEHWHHKAFAFKPGNHLGQLMPLPNQVLTFFWTSGDGSCGGPRCPSHRAGVLPSPARDFKSTWLQHVCCLMYLRLVLQMSQRAVLVSPFRLLDDGPLLPLSQTWENRTQRNQTESTKQAVRKQCPAPSSQS